MPNQFTMPDGKVIKNVPDGVTEQQVLAAYQKKMSEQKNTNRTWGQYTKTAPKAIWEGAKAGTTFGAADEIQSAIAAGVAYPFTDASFGDLYNQALGDFRQSSKKSFEDHPFLYGLSNIAGAIPTSAALTVGAPVSALSNLGAKGYGTIAGNAALQGGLYGFLAGEGGATERAENAGTTATISALAAPALVFGANKVADAVGNVGNSMVRRTAKQLGKNIDEQVASQTDDIVLPADQNAIGMIIDRLKKDYPNPIQYQNALRSYIANNEKTLAEVGKENIDRLAIGAAQRGEGEAISRSALTERASGAINRTRENVSQLFKTNTNFYDDLERVVKEGQEAASPLYKEAFKANKSVSSKKIDRILSTPSGQQALATARENMGNKMALMGVAEKEITEQAKDAVLMGQLTPDAIKGGVASGLKLETHDYIKKAFDDLITSAKSSGDRGKVRELTQLKKAYVSELDGLDKTGLYAKARNTAGDYLSNEEAMLNGQNFFKYDREELPRLFKSLGKSEKRSFKIGVAKAIREKLDDAIANENVGASKNPYDLIFKNAKMRENLKSILPENDFKTLEKQLMAEKRLFDLKNRVIGGSPTAFKQRAALELDPEGSDLIQEISKKGPVGATSDRLVQWITNKFNGIGDKNAKEIAKILYETDPVQKLALTRRLMSRDIVAKASKTGDLSKLPPGAKATQISTIKTLFQLEDAMKKAVAKSRKEITSGTSATVAAGLSNNNIVQSRQNLPEIEVRPLKKLEERK